MTNGGERTQMATLIAVYANWPFAKMKGIGWSWGMVIWLFSIVTFFPLDIFKFAIRYFLSGKAWNNAFDNKVNTETRILITRVDVHPFIVC